MTMHMLRHTRSGMIYCVYIQYYRYLTRYPIMSTTPARPTMTTAAPALSPGLPAYAELFCLSNFSFLQGASHAEELVARAAQLGYTALAITDECSLAGVVRAHAQAKRVGLPLLIGAHFRLTDPGGGPALSLLALACNREGYGNLAELITLGRTRRSEEHTSELQSLRHLVCRLLLEKKKHNLDQHKIKKNKKHKLKQKSINNKT